jgi:hypothetical protein
MRILVMARPTNHIDTDAVVAKRQRSGGVDAGSVRNEGSLDISRRVRDGASSASYGPTRRIGDGAGDFASRQLGLDAGTQYEKTKD